MTISELCKNLGLNQEIQREAEAKLSAMGINLNNPNEVRGGINSLVGRVKPFMGLALPLLRKISPKISEATGYSVDELYNEFNNGNSSIKPDKREFHRTNSNIYDKYKNL